MKEEFLHYLWRYRLYFRSELHTTNGVDIQVVDVGHPHQDGGPDLHNARIRIGELLWAGHVEIHFRSSQWYEHGHHLDPAYDNVVLHVVLEADRVTKTSKGSDLDTLELKGRIPQGIAQAYEHFMNDRKKRIPCEDMLPDLPPLLVWSWVDRLSVERIQRKAERVRGIAEICGKDLRSTFFYLLARYFGGRVNATPFEQLCNRTPLRILLRERKSLRTLEALLFGQSGMLKEAEGSAYAKDLFLEYRFLQRKYGLRPMEASAWRFLRMRPADFPTLRIAQLAAFIHENGDPWTALPDLGQEKEVQHIFRVRTSEYWRFHYKFDRERKRKASGRVGQEMARRLVINALAPFLFFYGEERDQPERKEQAFKILEGMKPEEDRVQREWKRLGIIPDNASRSQGTMELMETYCDSRNCLKCAIGDRILKNQAS